MGLWMKKRTGTADETLEDIISTIQGFPYVAPYNQAVTIGFNLSAQTGQYSDVVIGQRLLSQNYQPVAQDRFPINPDDFLLGPFPMIRGEQLKIAYRDTASATPSQYIAILSNP